MTSLLALSQSEILGLTIIGEARGEPVEGQVAVGCVIRNRVTARSRSYSEICLAPKQFSCWNENDPNRPYLDELVDKLTVGEYFADSSLRQCMFIAIGIHDGVIKDNTYGAQYYMTTELFMNHRPEWAKRAKNIVVKGHQTFFNL